MVDPTYYTPGMAMGLGPVRAAAPAHERVGSLSERGGRVGRPVAAVRPGVQRWTLSAGQLIDIGKWNLLRHIPVKMRGGRR